MAPGAARWSSLSTTAARAAHYGYWTFLARPRYTTLASRVRIAAWLLVVGRFGGTVRVRLVPSGIDIWLRPGRTDIVTLAQVWGWRQYELPIDAPKTIIDGGANIGLASLFFALHWPEAQIIAVEPDPENFALLERNVRLVRNVRPVQAALWSSAEALVVVNPQAPANSYRVEPGPGGVLGVTVAELCDGEGWETLGLLKLDIEGAELEVLDGSAAWIGRVEALAAELHDHEKPGCTEAFRDATAGFEHRGTRRELDTVWR